MNYIDDDVKKERILSNLSLWDNTITKYPNQKYNSKVASLIRDSLLKKGSLRLLLKKKSAIENEQAGYLIGKHFVNSGVAPSKITVVSLEDCYLHIRGFGDSSKFKDNLFNPDKRVLIITDVEDIKPIHVIDNVSQFWEDILTYIEKYNINAIFCFNDNKSKKWYFNSPEVTTKLKNLKFVEI